MMEDFKGRIGIDRAQSTYKQYEILYKQLKQLLREEYHIEDIPLTELDLPFIEALNFFFRVKRKMKPRTVKARIVLLNKMIRLALHRKIITRPPFDGFELEKTDEYDIKSPATFRPPESPKACKTPPNPDADDNPRATGWPDRCS